MLIDHEVVIHLCSLLTFSKQKLQILESRAKHKVLNELSRSSSICEGNGQSMYQIETGQNRNCIFVNVMNTLYTNVFEPKMQF